MVVSTLSAPVTILRAVSALDIDDRASVEGVSHTVPRDAVRCLVERLASCFFGELERFFLGHLHGIGRAERGNDV